MESENGKIEGDVQVEGELSISGLVTGSITVRPGGSLILEGLCLGDLIVDAEGVAVVTGTVSRNVDNRGTVVLRGMVGGNVVSHGGRLQRYPDAVVCGSVQA